MIDVQGKPLLGHVIDYWRRFTSEFIFVVRYKKEVLIDYVRGLPIQAEFVEQTELKGIAHAVTYAEPLVRDKFALVLADCVCKGDFSFPDAMTQGIGVWETDDEEDIRRSYSVEIRDGLVSRVVEKPKLLVNRYCGMGFYFFNRSVFDFVRRTPPSPLRNEIEITDTLQLMIDHGEKLSPLHFAGEYMNLTYPKDLGRLPRL
jgi:glucose-1-phosphate thymidylyltransferase